jgi:hypothetical protein
MATTSRFPSTIHVTLEGQDTRGEYFAVHSAEAGFQSIDETTTVAVYQLVSVGRVTVTKTFEAPTAKATRR